jgi:D-arabinose 1-dehydrogenase-like Zn-dependent alcohol dehydrogenase
MRDNDWGVTDYPVVLGHEGIGIVTNVGSCVTTLKEGDRVGVAWIRDSCGNCDACLVGRENMCAKGYQGTFLGPSAGCWGKNKLMYNNHGGAFSKITRIEAKFAVKIPDEIPSASAAPFLCGGGTVFEPLENYAKAGSKVGIRSLGGLGMSAVKLAKCNGSIVTAFSRGTSKKVAAIKAGATVFVDTTDEADMAAQAGTLDLLIDTCPINGDLAPLMNLLKFDGTYVRVGIPPGGQDAFNYSWIPLIFTQRKIAGSVVTGTARMKKMFDLIVANKDLCLDCDSSWSLKVIHFSEVNAAMDMLKNGTNKGYRTILEWEDAAASTANACVDCFATKD